MSRRSLAIWIAAAAVFVPVAMSPPAQAAVLPSKLNLGYIGPAAGKNGRVFIDVRKGRIADASLSYKFVKCSGRKTSSGVWDEEGRNPKWKSLRVRRNGRFSLNSSYKDGIYYVRDRLVGRFLAGGTRVEGSWQVSYNASDRRGTFKCRFPKVRFKAYPQSRHFVGATSQGGLVDFTVWWGEGPARDWDDMSIVGSVIFEDLNVNARPVQGPVTLACDNGSTTATEGWGGGADIKFGTGGFDFSGDTFGKIDGTFALTGRVPTLADAGNRRASGTIEMHAKDEKATPPINCSSGPVSFDATARPLGQ